MRGRPKREFVITHCGYCGKPLSGAEMEYGKSYCGRCHSKLREVKKFIQACDEFKELIGYEGILEEREKRKKRENMMVII